jgi:hypothetical protein
MRLLNDSNEAIAQQFQAVPMRLRIVFKAISKRLLSNCKPITVLLRSDFDGTAKRLQTERKAFSKRLQSNRKPIAK